METEAAIRRGSMQVTALLLVAAGVLLGLGFAGIGASPLVVVGLLALAGALFLARPQTDHFGRHNGLNIDYLLQSLWVAVLVAALPLVIEADATPAEVQALGGLIGLAGMANYFIRPLYLLGYDLVSAVRDRGSERVNGR